MATSGVYRGGVVVLLVLVGVIAFSILDRSRRVFGGAVAGALSAGLVAALLALMGYSVLLGRPFLAVAAAVVGLVAGKSWWTARRHDRRSEVIRDR